MARRPRTETQARTRHRLLDAAARLLEERGFRGTSVAEMAKAAGCTTGAIYANFERKEGLAMAVLERSIEDGEAALVEALGARGDLASRLIAVIRWRRAQTDLDAFAILRYELWLLALRDPKLRADLTAPQRRMQEKLAQLLDEQAADGLRSSTSSWFPTTTSASRRSVLTRSFSDPAVSTRASDRPSSQTIRSKIR